MKASFSEFQFAYSVTREIEDKILFGRWKLGMPRIINQVEEAKCGYDAAFKGRVVSLFLQYKVPEKLTKKSAKQWRDMKAPYYRFDIYPADLSPQHNLLCDLARRDIKNRVFYCAPAFVLYDELCKYHKSRMVAGNSVFINCRNLDIITGSDKHNICYTLSPKKCKMYSEPVQAMIQSGWQEILKTTADYSYENVEDFVNTMTEAGYADKKAETIPEKLSKIAEEFSEKGVHILLLKI